MSDNGTRPEIPVLTREQQEYLDRHGPVVFQLLALQCMRDSVDWFGDSHAAYSLPHFALALCGETGEFANLVKKVDRGSLDYKDASVRFDMGMEAADIITYLFEILGLLNVNGFKLYQKKRGTNMERFTKQRQERDKARG